MPALRAPPFQSIPDNVNHAITTTSPFRMPAVDNFRRPRRRHCCPSISGPVSRHRPPEFDFAAAGHTIQPAVLRHRYASAVQSANRTKYCNSCPAPECWHVNSENAHVLPREGKGALQTSRQQLRFTSQWTMPPTPPRCFAERRRRRSHRWVASNKCRQQCRQQRLPTSPRYLSY